MDAGTLREQLNLFVLRTGSERKALKSLEEMTGLPRTTIYDFRRNTRQKPAQKTLDRLNDIFDEGEWSEFGGKRGPQYGLRVQPRHNEFSGHYLTQVLKPPKGTARFLIVYRATKYKTNTGSTGWLPASNWNTTVNSKTIIPHDVMFIFFDIPGGIPL